MPVTLEQHTQAAMPDKGTVGSGLRITCTSGPDGALLEYVLPQGVQATHMRVIFAHGSATGGSVQLFGAWDAQADPLWWVVFDADQQAVSLQTPTDQSPQVILPGALDWHSMEVGFDAASQLWQLSINGIMEKTLSAAGSLDPTRYWLGGLNKSAALTGVYDMDDWVIADEPIGPLRVTPGQTHAGDPTRWLVIYNRNSSDSAAWADYYRSQRGVPYANLCGLNLSSSEVIDAAEYLSLRQAMTDYLQTNGLDTQVMGVLLGLGVPGYVDFVDDGQLTSVASLLHTDAAHDQLVVNPLHQPAADSRPQAGSLNGVRLTARLDGADLATAKALVDQASAIIDQPLAAMSNDALWFDGIPEDGNINPIFVEPMQAWAVGQDWQGLRLPMNIASENGFQTIQNDAVYWGWGPDSVANTFFSSPAGPRAVCVQLSDAAPLSSTLRDPASTHWIRRALDAGYASVAAASRVYSLSALPQPRAFFEALRKGWTLAEAWLVAQPFLRSGLQLIGDPLMGVTFPAQGYDLYGPAAALEQVDLLNPMARLPENQMSFAIPSALLPGAEETTCYVVQHLDTQGRHDGETTSVCVQSVEGAARLLPPVPAWPDVDDWPGLASQGQVELILLWAVAPVVREINRIELESQNLSGDLTVSWSQVAKPGQRKICVYMPVTAQAIRYRWHVLAVSGASRRTPWSRPFVLAQASQYPMPVLEVSP